MTNRTASQVAKLENLRGYNPKTMTAWLIKDKFGRFWKYVSPPHWSGLFLDA